MLGSLDLTPLFAKSEHAHTKVTRFTSKVRTARASAALDARWRRRASRRARPAPVFARLSRAAEPAHALPHRAQLPAAELNTELTKVLSDMELSFEQKPFKTVISFVTDHGPGTCSAQVFVMAPGLHMVDFRRGQSDFLAFFKIFSQIKERMAHVIEAVDSIPLASPTLEGREKAGSSERQAAPQAERLPEEGSSAQASKAESAYMLNLPAGDQAGQAAEAPVATSPAAGVASSSAGATS